MTDRQEPAAFRHRNRIAGSALYVVVVCAAAIAIYVLASDARRELDILATAKGDASQWSLAQTEVEFLAFENAVLDALGKQEPDLDEIRKRFDVYYSRVQIVKSAQSLSKVRGLPQVGGTIGDIDRFLSETVDHIDGTDSALLAALPGIADQLKRLRPGIRSLSLAGVQVFSARSVIQRAEVSAVLFKLALVVSLLLTLLVITVIFLRRTSIASQRKTDEIARAESHLQAIVSTSIDAILVTSREGVILDFNGAAERIFGFKRHEVMGRNMIDLLIAPNAREAVLDEIVKTLGSSNQSAPDATLPSQGLGRRGQTFPVEISMSCAHTQQDEVVVAFIRDTSIRVAAQNELETALNRAVAGERAKADMLAVMSHEMRTPLNGVLGSLQLLSESDLEETQRTFIDAMESSGQLLLEHVNNVLEILRVDAGKAAVVSRQFDLGELVQTALAGMRNAANDRGTTLEYKETGAIPQFVSGDSTRLRRILVNLVGNAIKFTENGQITTEIIADTDMDEVTFRIHDTGLGIPETELDRIFDDFVTLDPSFGREVEGTGLGLGIVRRMVTLLEGELGVESAPGEGSVFWVRLPLPAVDTVETLNIDSLRTENDPAQYSASILVVEDNEINRMIVSEMLARMGCDVTEAVDGQKGVELAAAKAFDLIFMDISMPGKDGLTATREIRASQGVNRTTPIIALTAHVMSDDAKKFRQAGMDDVLVKPLSFSRLAGVLSDRLQPPLDQTVDDDAVVEELIAILGPENADRVIARAHADMRRGLDDLRHLASGDGKFDEIEKLAHRLCGSAGLIGCSNLRAGFINIEAAACECDGEDVRARIDEVEHMMTGLKPRLYG